LQLFLYRFFTFYYNTQEYMLVHMKQNILTGNPLVQLEEVKVGQQQMG